jgi:type I restriction enzyme M protein
MSDDTGQLTAKVWNLAGVLNNAGVGSGEYVEQITYLLFLKLDAERAADGLPSALPATCQWNHLAPLKGADLAKAYATALETLSRQPGLIGTIFARARNNIEEPAHLNRLVRLIEAETWSAFGADVKGGLYEGLLERTASDVKTGAGQYFTPRPVIEACVEVVAPRPGQTVCDPACGTGGFLLAAYAHMRQHGGAMDRRAERRMREEAFTGYDIVPGVARLAAMNLYLHGLGTGAATPIHRADALLADPGKRWDVILTNPPFGRKQSVRVFTGDGEAETEREDYERPDFGVTTGNKQLNFMQHIMTVLAPNGTAAVVLPDNVLFEGGAGERIRRKLLEQFDFHTLLRLPTGIFYRQGVKANVLFFEARPRRTEPWTEALWVYDLRTNKRFTLKERPLRSADMAEFTALARLSDRASRREVEGVERWKCFTYAELAARERLDLNRSWLREEGATDPASLPPPAEIAASIAEELETALSRFRAVAARLG